MYEIISDDVTTFDGDAILNSLGPGPSRIQSPGGIFRSILAKSNNPEGLLNEVIRKGSKLPYCGAFLTDSYGLACKQIVHVISPFSKDDDFACSMLKRAYANALKRAYDSGIRTICLPMIGTGANGYITEESFQTAKSAAFEFEKAYPDMHIVLSVFWGNTDLVAETRRKRREHRKALEESSYREDPEARWRWEQARAERGRQEMAERGFAFMMPQTSAIGASIPHKGIPTPTRDIEMKQLKLAPGDSFGDLIDKFISAREGSDAPETIDEGWKQIEAEITKARNDDEDEDSDQVFLGSNYRFRWHLHPDYKKKKTGLIWTKPERVQVLMIAGALNLTKRQANFLFRFCGYYLSEFDNKDMVIKACYEFLATETENAALLTICQLYEEGTGEKIFKPRPEKSKTE